MKMPRDMFDRLKSACQTVKGRHPNCTPQTYIDNNIGKNNLRRFRWDLFWAVQEITKDDYTDLLDSHIDTALRRIVKELYETE